MNELEQLENINVDRLYKDVSDLIENAKVKVVSHVNTEFVILNWNIGNRIKNELLDNRKPEYGKKVIKNLSKRLMEKYGRGYSYSNLYRMLQINKDFEDFENFATLSQKFEKAKALDLKISLRLIFMEIFYLHQKRYKVIPKTIKKG